MKLHFSLLEKNECSQIHEGSLEVLSTVGMKIETEEMRNTLQKKGAKVDHSAETVIFPKKLVEDAIELNKKQVESGRKLHLINGVTSQKTDKKVVQAKFGGGCEIYLDWKNQEIKQASAKALLDFIRLGEKIPEVTFVGNPIVMKDDLEGNKLEERMRRIKTAALVSKHTRKVGSMEVWDEREIDLFMEMGAVVMDGEAAYENDPCFVTAKETISPFFLDKNAGDVLLGLAKRRLPCTIIPMPITGMSTPINMVGNAIVGNAEILGVITAIKAVYPEAIVGGGTISGLLDMKTATASFSAPEAILQDIAIAEVHETLYGLNYLVGTGYTDAKYPNPQLLAEKTAKFLMTYLSGRYTYPVGLLNAGAIFSAEQALVDLEICNYIHAHFESSFDFPGIPEIIQVVKDVGIRGNTIGEPHTFEHFKKNWFPDIMDRSGFSTIEENQKTEIYTKAHEMVQKHLSGDDFWHISSEKEKEIDLIVEKANGIL